MSAEAARRFWPSESPVGKRIKMAAYAQAPWLTVVGVAGDVQHMGWDRRGRPTVYVPFAQAPNRYMDVALRASGDPHAARRGRRSGRPSVGVYGVMSYSVNHQTHDIGVRMALGVHRRNLLAMFLRGGFLMALAGVALGLHVAFLLARAMASLVFGIAAGAPATFTLIPAVLIVDPIAALRYE